MADLVKAAIASLDDDPPRRPSSGEVQEKDKSGESRSNPRKDKESRDERRKSGRDENVKRDSGEKKRRSSDGDRSRRRRSGSSDDGYYYESRHRSSRSRRDRRSRSRDRHRRRDYSDRGRRRDYSPRRRRHGGRRGYRGRSYSSSSSSSRHSDSVLENMEVPLAQQLAMQQNMMMAHMKNIPSLPGAGGAMQAAALPGLAGIPGIVPGLLPTPAVPKVQVTAQMGAQHRLDTMTRKALELYIGGLPRIGISNQMLIDFVNARCRLGGMGMELEPGASLVTYLEISSEGTFAFGRFRSEEEAEQAMGLLQGAEFLGYQLKVGRPKGYVPGAGANLAAKLAAPAAPAVQLAAAVASVPSNSLRLLNMLEDDMLDDAQELADVSEDIKDECAKYGTVRAVQLCVAKGAEHRGEVFVTMVDIESASKTKDALGGRTFSGAAIVATFCTEEDITSAMGGGSADAPTDAVPPSTTAAT